jgi:hypothetical protein
MDRPRRLGTFMMLFSAVQMLIMVVGVMRRSYLAIALPVIAAVGLISALTFWVGWTMANTEPDLAELESQDALPSLV